MLRSFSIRRGCGVRIADGCGGTFRSIAMRCDLVEQTPDNLSAIHIITWILVSGSAVSGKPFRGELRRPARLTQTIIAIYSRVMVDVPEIDTSTFPRVTVDEPFIPELRWTAQPNEWPRVARTDPLLFLLFMCRVAMTSAHHQSHNFPSLPPHIDTTSAVSKAPKNLSAQDGHPTRLPGPDQGRCCHGDVCGLPNRAHDPLGCTHDVAFSVVLFLAS